MKQQDMSLEIRKSLSLPVSPIDDMLLDSKDAGAISLDTFIEDAKPDNQSPEYKMPDIKKQILDTVPEEEKDSNFGDYGEESSDASESVAS